MRILHIYKDYAPILGGIENHVRVLAEAQAAEGHTVRVLVTRRPGTARTETLNGVLVERAPSLGAVASTPLSPALFAGAHAAEADLIHLHSPYPVAELAVLGRRTPYVITLHAEPTRTLQRAILTAYAPLFRRIVAGAAALLVTSPQAAARSRWVSADDDRVAVVPLGSDPVRFQPASTGAAPVEAGSLRLLFTGLLRHYKGVDVLLRALPRLAPTITLTIAGDGPEGERLRLLGHQLGLDQRVRFLGRVADDALPGLYRGHDVFVLPAVSPAEAFGQVLVEAMLSGLPCVTTELGTGTSYVVQDDVTGRVVAPRSPRALATTLQALAGDPATRARLGAAGRARALEHFTTERMLARVRAVYDRALAP